MTSLPSTVSRSNAPRDHPRQNPGGNKNHDRIATVAKYCFRADGKPLFPPYVSSFSEMFVPIVYDFSEIFKRFRPAWGFFGTGIFSTHPGGLARVHFARKPDGPPARLPAEPRSFYRQGKARLAQRNPPCKATASGLKARCTAAPVSKTPHAPPRPAASPLQTPTLLPLHEPPSCHCREPPSCHCREPTSCHCHEPPLAIVTSHPLAIVRSHPLAIVGKI